MMLDHPRQREAERALGYARKLVARHGTQPFVIGDHTKLRVIPNYSAEANTLAIHANDEPVMLSTWRDDDGDNDPPVIITFKPGFWKELIRQNAEALET